MSLYRIRPDGSHLQQLTHINSGIVREPVWSPNGQWIIFSSAANCYSRIPCLLGDFDLYRIRPDGSDLQQLVHTDAYGVTPAWSPDGQWVVFASGYMEADTYLYKMRMDGSHLQRLTHEHNRTVDMKPTWSPDGQWIVFASDKDGSYGSDLYRIRPDGSDLQQLTHTSETASEPAWSPDGQWIVFKLDKTPYGSDLYRIQPDGSNLQQLTHEHRYIRHTHPTWSPDGQWIVFASDRDSSHGSNLYRIQSDGSNLQQLTYHSWSDVNPAFSPLIDLQFNGSLLFIIGMAIFALSIGVRTIHPHLIANNL